MKEFTQYFCTGSSDSIYYVEFITNQSSSTDQTTTAKYK